MLSSFEHPVQDCRRQMRLLWRHVRFGHAHFCAAGRRARSEALAELFRGTNAFLRSLDVEFWLDFGTLLGWQREGAIISHDYDIDFGAPLSAYPVLLAARRRLPPGFALHDTSHRHNGPKLYVTFRGWEADVYFYAEEGAHLLPQIRSRIPSERLPVDIAWIRPLQPARFLGENTFVPASPIRYLTHLYGYLGPDAVRDPSSGYFRPRQP